MTSIDPWAIPDEPHAPRAPDPRQVARLLRTWVRGYDTRGCPLYAADVETDCGAFVTARLVGARWVVEETT